MRLSSARWMRARLRVLRGRRSRRETRAMPRAPARDRQRPRGRAPRNSACRRRARRRRSRRSGAPSSDRRPARAESPRRDFSICSSRSSATPRPHSASSHWMSPCTDVGLRQTVALDRSVEPAERHQRLGRVAVEHRAPVVVEDVGAALRVDELERAIVLGERVFICADAREHEPQLGRDVLRLGAGHVEPTGFLELGDRALAAVRAAGSG